MSDIIELSKPSRVSMADEWYELSKPDHFWMSARFSKLLPYIHASYRASHGRYLEIGCGTGSFIRQLDNVVAFPTDGCDLNLTALRMVGKIRGNVYAYDIHDLNSEMTSKYDGIFLLDVLEHIDDDKNFLSSALRHLKPGGMVFINVPALMSVFSKYDVAAGHKRRYSKARLTTLLDDLGLKEVTVSYWGLFLLPLLVIRKHLLKAVDDEKVIRAGFRPPSLFVNLLLRIVTRVEGWLFKNPPLGTSVIAVARKSL